jgi:hypothetical protein
MEAKNKRTPRSKDEQIIAQSSLKFVLEWGEKCGYCVDIKDVVLISRVVEEYVIYGYDTNIGERLEKIGDYLKNKQ